jgi:hypothetical protein
MAQTLNRGCLIRRQEGVLLLGDDAEMPIAVGPAPGSMFGRIARWLSTTTPNQSLIW